MFLSRIQLNPRRREARWLMSSPQRVHAAVLASFPDAPTGDLDGGPRVLWRLDEEVSTMLYVVSPEQPDFAGLAEQAGWPTTERGTVKPYDALLDALDVGQRWAFRLTANPSRYVRDPADGKARRRGHVTVGHQEQWLVDRAPEHGFMVASPDDAVEGARSGPFSVLTKRSTHEFTRGTSSRPVTISTAQFDGELEITDAGLLRKALVSGIGPAKAYGCGLLTLAPITR